MVFMTEIERLIQDIERYCAAHGIAETTFGARAVNDGKFVPRLRAGRTVRLTTLEKVRMFLVGSRRAA
jgi:hypothetical protein